MPSESKVIGAILVLVAIVFLSPSIMNQVAINSSGGGFWAILPQLAPLLLMALAVITIAFTLWILFTSY